MSVEWILLDLDGVAVDFSSEACRLFGKPDLEIRSWDSWTYLGVTEREFWDTIDAAGHEFWRNLPAYPWYSQLMSLFQGYPVTFSTTPSKCASSAYGKRLWFLDQFGSDFTDYMMGGQKFLMAKPGAVLIDDSDKNVAKFREHGGSVVLFPQLWNSGRTLLPHTDRVDYVRSELNKINDRKSTRPVY